MKRTSKANRAATTKPTIKASPIPMKLLIPVEEILRDRRSASSKTLVRLTEEAIVKAYAPHKFLSIFGYPLETKAA